VQSGSTRLLIDAGISGRQAEMRLAAIGQPIGDIDAVLISHDHKDHGGSMGIFNRKFDLSILVTEKTLAVARSHYSVGSIADTRHFLAGDTIQLGDFQVETVSTPHDCADGLVFVLDDGRHRLGVMTDLGHVFSGLAEVVESLDAVILESNYDSEFLSRGPYPEWLKQRIRGPHGHISNQESARLLKDAAGSQLKWACLAHLSQQNNSPIRALETHQRILDGRFTVHVAPRHEATGLLHI
jgi:phosphoribosyl 1,2-cyclic phosphodiesterase